MEVRDAKIRGKIIKNSVIFFGILLSFLLIDLLCVYFTDKPIFYTRKEEDSIDNYKVYHGFLYKTYDCNGNVKIKSLGSDYYCGYIPTDSGFKIVDETEDCPQALEKIHETILHNYYLSCIKSGNIKIIFDDGSTYTLREVLDNDILSINELMDNGLKVIKENKI